MGNDIGSALSFKAVCFDFRSTNVGSSVIGTRSTTGFDVITLNHLHTLVLTTVLWHFFGEDLSRSEKQF